MHLKCPANNLYLFFYWLQHRRKRRQTRGRRGVILPDREAPKCHRTLIHNLTYAPDPADDTTIIAVTATGFPPVLRKLSSLGYDNYSAITDKSATPSSRQRARGRPGTAATILRGATAMQATGSMDSDSGRPGSAGPSTPSRDSREVVKKRRVESGF